MKEGDISKLIMLALSQAGCTIWRNESAGVWVGKVLHKEVTSVTLGNARFIKAGLCTGSSDLIGLTSCGKFLAVEVKTPTGRATKEQIGFINHVNNRGGFGFVAHSPEMALMELEKCRNR